MSNFYGLGPVKLTYVLFELDMKNRPEIKVPEYVCVRRYDAEKDAEILAILHNQTMSICEDFALMDEKFVKKIPHHVSFIAEINGHPVGMVITGVGKIKKGKQGYIAELGVLESYRYKGVGSALLKHVLDFFESEGIEKVTCEVLESNIDTLYVLKRKANFEEIERITFVTSQLPLNLFKSY
ncbi:MAG: GNAT family N-acetyltransferase [Candidatus Jordarchaeum sp.]|uniref:GNAT family N-acetyltransferase n=1 Tax=Candidatus Jordarchaeum sp. TaxID=2823881 RepID=UPI004049FDA3